MTVMIEIQRAIPSPCQKALSLLLWELQYKKDLLPEETLYEKFIPNKDRALFKTWHSSSWEDKLRLLDKFQDKRCSWFGQKIIYQEAPQILPPDLYKNIKSEIARRILSKNKEKWQTVIKI